MQIKGFKVEPVRWLTVTTAVLVALSGVDEFMDILPDNVRAYILIAIAVGSGLIGATKVRNAVTTLDNPRDNDGTPLVRADGADRAQ